jgi:putative FmdB family regulatory protein
VPIFEYICRDCERRFERIVPRYDSKTDCVHCKSENIEKQLSVFAVAGPSEGSAGDFAAESSGCGRCGAPQPGMCGMS